MPDPGRDSNTLATAELAHHAVRCAAEAVRAVECRLLLDVGTLATEAPLRAFQSRIESWCLSGGVLAGAVSDLENIALPDPAESLDI